MMKCLCSGERLKVGNVVQSSKSMGRNHSAGKNSSHTGEGERRIDNGNIEEAESSLREGGCLNYEEARALLGRLEYQRGNTEAALRVFDGIDIAALAPKIKTSIAKRAERHKSRTHDYAAAPMSMHAISLLFEAILLKSRSLQDLGRYKEAAFSCNSILETVEAALPDGFPENFGTDSKLLEMISKAVELLPELWKLAGLYHESILAYRRALLYSWKLDAETTTRIQKEFAIFLLYGCTDSSPPLNLRYQLNCAFVPRNNTEEAILLLMILLRKFTLKMAKWDSSIIDHLIYALSVSGSLKPLAHQIEELLPKMLSRQGRYYTLALCYLGEGDGMVALNLLKKLLAEKENPDCVKALLLASKICSENNVFAEDGVSFARKALTSLDSRCDPVNSVANRLLGISLSNAGRLCASDSERTAKQIEALEALEKANRLMEGKDSETLYNLSLENADQRRLDIALKYAKLLLKLEGGSNVKSWILLARILSAQKRLIDAETVVCAALEQAGRWCQGDLLRTKAKLQIGLGKMKNAVKTYTYLLAILQLKAKSPEVGTKSYKDEDRNLEIETWNDLAIVYTNVSLWSDAEVCLSKSRVINPFFASTWHATGKFYEAKGLLEEAMGAFRSALEIEATYVPSLVSAALILKQLGYRPSTVKSFLTDALRVDRTNHHVWYQLGLLYEAEGSSSALEAAECFQTSALLQESAPIEPFR